MAILGRKTLKSSRTRMRRIDVIFEWTAKIILIGYFIFAFISWLTYRDAFRIDNVTVVGVHAVSPQQVRSIAHDLLNKKILWRIDKNNKVFYSKTHIREAIFALDSRIKNVNMEIIKRKNLAITITEFLPANLWCGPDAPTSATSTRECFLADNYGYIYAKAPHYSGYPFPVFYTNIPENKERLSPIGLFILPAVQFTKITIMSKELEKNNTIVSEIRQTNEHDYVFLTDRSWVLLWSSLEDSAKSVANLNLVLSEIIQSGNTQEALTSIDLRFGNKIFYK